MAKPGREEVSDCSSITCGKLLFWRYIQPDYHFQISKNVFMSLS